MKKLTVMIIACVFFLTGVAPVNASVKGITKSNYLEYEKTVADSYGYNKGECNPEYMEGEEYFYSEYYDHWNVCKVYDPSLIPASEPKVKEVKTKTNLSVAKAWAKKHYKGYKIKVVAYGKVPKNRKGKKTVYIERMRTKSDGGKNGHVIKDGSFVKYAKKVKKGKIEICYAIWNPKNNACDDVVAFVSCKVVK